MVLFCIMQFCVGITNHFSDLLHSSLFHLFSIFAFQFTPTKPPHRGGAFAEWDFLRGLREGWMPPIPAPHISSESIYGDCYEIYNRTDDSYSIVDEYPDPRTLDWKQWQGWTNNDDFVMSDPNIPVIDHDTEQHSIFNSTWIIPLCLGIAIFWTLKRLRQSFKRRERLGYTELKV